jgi:hypothetical protein
VTPAADASPPLLGVAAWYRGGAPIGPVTGLYVDEESDRPGWAVVSTERLLPLSRAALGADGRLVVALPDLTVELSPPLASWTVHLDLGDEDRLHGYYAAVLDRPRRPTAIPDGAATDVGTTRLRRFPPGGAPLQGDGWIHRG